MSGSRNEAFLARWSKRKQDARVAQQSAEMPPRSDEEAPEATEAGAPQAEPALTAEELAALPPIEAVTAQTDLSVFLRRGVPESLRLAAMRKMWVLDPAVRDFVGDARDYAYDWNVPGGVPGFSPLSPGDDVEAAVERALDGTRKEASTASQDVEQSDSQPELAGQPDETRTAKQDTDSADENPRASSSADMGQNSAADRSCNPPPGTEEGLAAMGQASDSRVRVPLGRHGRARPV